MSLINMCVAARHAVADWRRRQRAAAELSALDDRSLADIGIHRSEIPAIIAGMHKAAGAAKKPAAASSGLRPVSPLDFIPRLDRRPGRHAL